MGSSNNYTLLFKNLCTWLTQKHTGGRATFKCKKAFQNIALAYLNAMNNAIKIKLNQMS